MKNGIDDLRNHLFATLEALQDEDKPMDLDRAKTVAEVAQTLINAAKVEVEFIKNSGQRADSKFFESKPELPGPSSVKKLGAA